MTMDGCYTNSPSGLQTHNNTVSMPKYIIYFHVVTILSIWKHCYKYVWTLL